MVSPFSASPRPMRFLVPALLIVLTACSDPAPSVAPTSTPTTPPTSVAPTPPADPGAGEELSDDVAATVEDNEITQQELDTRVELVTQLPPIAEQLEGEDGEAARQQLTAQLLSQLILRETALVGAERDGIEISDDEVAEFRSGLEDEAGGPEALVDEAEAQGIPEDVLDRELRVLVVLEQVAQTSGGAEGDEEGNVGADVAVQQWLAGHLMQTAVVVAPRNGQWDPTSGQVVPAQAAA